MASVAQSSTVVTGLTASVTPDGIDNTGTTDVSAAILALIASTPDGGTVDFQDGTFRCNSLMRVSERTGLTLMNGTFICDLPYNATSPAPPARHWEFKDCVNLLLDNFNVRGGNPVNDTAGSGDNALSGGQHAIQFRNGHDLTARNCTVSHVYGDGFSTFWDDYTVPPPYNVLIEDCEVHDVARHGLGLINGSGIVVTRFDVWNFKHWAVDIECDDPEPRHCWQEDIEFGDWRIGANASDRGWFDLDMKGDHSTSVWIHGARNSNKGGGILGWTSTPDNFMTASGGATFLNAGNLDTLIVEDCDASWSSPVIAANRAGMTIARVNNVIFRDNHFTGTDSTSRIVDFLNVGDAIVSGNVLDNGTDDSYTESWTVRGIPPVEVKVSVSEGGVVGTGVPSRSAATTKGIVYADHIAGWDAARGTRQLVVNMIGDQGSTYVVNRAMRDHCQLDDVDYGYLQTLDKFSLNSSYVTWSTVSTSTGHYGTWGVRPPSVVTGGSITVALDPCTEVDVYYATTSGAWTWSVDGSTPATRTVNPSGGNWDVEHITGLDGDSSHTLVLAGASSTKAQFLHLLVRRGSGNASFNYPYISIASGDTTSRMAIGSMTAGTVQTDAVAALVANRPDLLVVQFGWQEFCYYTGNLGSSSASPPLTGIPDPGIGPDAMKSNVRLMIQAQAAVGGKTLLMMDPWWPTLWNSGTTAPAINLDAQRPFHKALKDLAAEEPTCAYLDPTADYFMGNPYTGVGSVNFLEFWPQYAGYRTVSAWGAWLQESILLDALDLTT